MNNELVLIVDFGGQYNQLIARRVRENNVYCEVISYKDAYEKILNKSPKAIIFTGGPRSVNELDAPDIDKRVFELGIPILGICYGAQLIAKSFGGDIKSLKAREYGKTQIKYNSECKLYKNVESNNIVWMSHTDQVVKLPNDFANSANTDSCNNAAFYNDNLKIYAVQFHPEVNHSIQGEIIIKNFLFEISKLSADFTPSSFINDKIMEIKNIIGNKKAICALSGGVDSSVAAVLVHKAIGDNLTCIFVDHGLMRKNEGDFVEKVFKEKFDMNLIRVNAEEDFLESLKGVTDPERKRKIIGEKFIRVFEKYANNGEYDFLVQGTIYPDVIESGTESAAVIKSHHNVGGIPKDIKLKIVEPLRELFKDEVRKFGLEMNIDENLINRHPFPGPGLGIRVLGEVTKYKCDILREADAIFREELELANLDKKIWQAFASLLDQKTVGVMGDERTYSYIVALRAVTSVDGMTGEFFPIDYSILDKVARRIVNEVNGVNRVLYDVTGKPPATIEFE